jgi:hypothetical protein
MMYEAIRYAADGHAGEQDPTDPMMGDGAVLCRGSLDECRAAIAARGVDLDRCRWDGDFGPCGPESVEAYHESGGEGCGGWAIRRAQ